MTGLADFHTNGDLVAALRDPQNLAFDMADDPEGVRAAVDYVTESYPLMYDDLYDRIAAAGQPPSIWGVAAQRQDLRHQLRLHLHDLAADVRGYHTARACAGR